MSNERKHSNIFKIFDKPKIIKTFSKMKKKLFVPLGKNSSIFYSCRIMIHCELICCLKHAKYKNFMRIFRFPWILFQHSEVKNSKSNVKQFFDHNRLRYAAATVQITLNINCVVTFQFAVSKLFFRSTKK